MDKMLGWLKETAVFMLAAQMVFHFMPGKKYERYGRMVAGVLVLAQICIPMLTLGKEARIGDFLGQIDRWEGEQDMFVRQLEGLEEMQTALSQEELTGYVQEKVAKEAAQAGVAFQGVSLKNDVLVIEVSDSLPSAFADPETSRELTQRFAEALDMDPKKVEVICHG